MQPLFTKRLYFTENFIVSRAIRRLITRNQEFVQILVTRTHTGKKKGGTMSTSFSWIWSGRRDSNSRPLAPHASALPGCATPRENEIMPCSYKKSKSATKKKLKIILRCEIYLYRIPRHDHSKSSKHEKSQLDEQES